MRAWWYLALSSIRTRRFPRERCLSRRIKKRRKDSPLNIGSKAVIRLPVRTLAAPKHATDLRVGACKRMGSLSSGGTHIRQRVPCCWKWHSSELHRSTLGSAARRRSFFKGRLRFRVGLGDHGAGLAQPESHLAEQPLALAPSQRDLIPLAQMFGQQLAVPQGLGKAEVTRATPQVVFQGLPMCIGQSTRPPGSLTVLQSGKSDFLEAIDPALHRALAPVEPQRGLTRTHAVRHQQYAVKPVIVPGLIVALDFLTYGDTHNFRVADFQFPHGGKSYQHWRRRQCNRIMRHYLRRYV